MIQKHHLLALFLFIPTFGFAQSPNLTKIWETDTVVAIPESVMVGSGSDEARKTLYVSLVDGAPWEADGKGGIAKLSTDGKTYNGTWVTGLNAPKGLGQFKNKLYAADLAEVVVIDIPTAKVVGHIPIEGATNLNDITVDRLGAVYVSDSESGTIYKIVKDHFMLYMDHLEGLNGLKASGKNLYILAKKSVMIADAGKHLKKITDLPNGGDGIEEVGNGDLIVSEWVGNVFYVYADGRKITLLDRKPEHKNTADIWFDQPTKTLYVPGFFGKTITAYSLQ